MCMPRNWSMAVPEGNGPIPQYAYVKLGGITMEESRRIMSGALDKAFDEPTENMRNTNQRLVGLEQEHRQPRLATEADVLADNKARKRMEDTAAVQAKHGDSCSAERVRAGPTSFDMKVEPPALPRRDDVLIDEGDAAPKPCLLPVDMRTPTAAGDLLSAGKASAATRIIFYQLPLRFCLTDETNSRTTTQYAIDYSNF